MRIRMRSVIAGAGAAVLLAVAAIAAPVAEAATRVLHTGRGGTFFVTNPGPASVGTVVAGIAVSAAVIGVVAWLGLRSGRGQGAQLSVVPSSGQDAGQSVPEAIEDRERKAA